MGGMKHIILIALLATPLSLSAQEADPDSGEIEEGFSLMEEGARLLFRGLMSEMEPALEEFSGMAEGLEPALEQFATQMGPALMDLMRTLDSIQYYEPPEILPNGDIIIRRRPDAPIFAPRENAPIDL